MTCKTIQNATRRIYQEGINVNVAKSILRLTATAIASAIAVAALGVAIFLFFSPPLLLSVLTVKAIIVSLTMSAVAGVSISWALNLEKMGGIRKRSLPIEKKQEIPQENEELKRFQALSEKLNLELKKKEDEIAFLKKENEVLQDRREVESELKEQKAQLSLNLMKIEGEKKVSEELQQKMAMELEKSQELYENLMQDLKKKEVEVEELKKASENYNALDKKYSFLIDDLTRALQEIEDEDKEILIFSPKKQWVGRMPDNNYEKKCIISPSPKKFRKIMTE